MMMDVPKGGLTHEVLTTFMAEACALVNNRPLAPVSSDPQEPTPLSPSHTSQIPLPSTCLLKGRNFNALCGKGFSIYRTPFGKDGEHSICKLCKTLESGKLNKEI
jgi:hypothetical protein